MIDDSMVCCGPPLARVRYSSYVFLWVSPPDRSFGYYTLPYPALPSSHGPLYIAFPPLAALPKHLPNPLPSLSQPPPALAVLLQDSKGRSKPARFRLQQFTES